MTKQQREIKTSFMQQLQCSMLIVTEARSVRCHWKKYLGGILRLLRPQLDGGQRFANLFASFFVGAGDANLLLCIAFRICSPTKKVRKTIHQRLFLQAYYYQARGVSFMRGSATQAQTLRRIVTVASDAKHAHR